ncbi:HK97 gp10 family phage protein [Bifidobacterium platyrrhinorum]|uniref:HK97 gp10 family phage protein n=1 Tax=Bifidobacterium platyrrhinorum TaxID=2661628 RepID=A0A6L9SUK5_9BIFI|nr:HK97 gp10 family phage protein [Bifidobacterium platyrrhinorum]NEG56134.1 HK97 gp10 family phage protein [Bifidobacterium platyrrhinorum]
MAGYGQTYIDFNESVFDEILNSAGVRAMCRGAAEKALAAARSNAPVDTGAYRDGLAVETVQHEHRTTYMVVGHDPKTMLVESQTGNLTKALKAAKS